MPTQNIYDLVDTWNAGATTFTAVKMNVTDTASAAGSLLMDLQVGGSSKVNFRKDGSLSLNVGGGNPILIRLVDAYGTAEIAGASGGIRFKPSGSTNSAAISWSGNFLARSAGAFSFLPGEDYTAAIGDTILTRRAAANLRLGAADAAAPVAQTLSVQSVVAGTTNTAGANLTITGSQGTGTGAGGSIVFQVAPAGSSGTAQNALATALTIDSTQKATFAAGADFTGTINALSALNVFGTRVYLDGSGVFVSNGRYYGFTGSEQGGTVDTRLYRDAANTLALRNGANAQTFRVYNTWTSFGTGTEIWERGKFAWESNALVIGTEKGANGGTARAVQVQTDGVTRMWFDASGHFVDVAASGVLGWTSRGYLRFTDVGVLNLSTSQSNASAGFDRLQFGGTTSSFPALKRSSTTLQARLADDSAFASVQGKLTTETAYTAGAPTATGYLVLYDSNGTAYRVPAVLN